MNAARAAGARGGTVLHGKGTGAKGAPKFYNITIAQEKEMNPDRCSNFPKSSYNAVYPEKSRS